MITSFIPKKAVEEWRIAHNGWTDPDLSSRKLQLGTVHYKIHYKVYTIEAGAPPHQLLIVSLFNWKRPDQNNEGMKE